jgi:hypothetical protein
MKRLSQNDIDEAQENSIMFETLEQQKAVSTAQEKVEAAKAHSWPVFEHPAPLSNEQLRCLSNKARELGRPLTDEERNVLLGDKAPQPRASAVRFLEV